MLQKPELKYIYKIQEYISRQLTKEEGIHILPSFVVVEPELQKARCSSEGRRNHGLIEDEDASTASGSSTGVVEDGEDGGCLGAYYYSIGIDATNGVKWKMGDLLGKLINATVGWSNFRLSLDAHYLDYSTEAQSAKPKTLALSSFDAAAFKRFDCYIEWAPEAQEVELMIEGLLAEIFTTGWARAGRLPDRVVESLTRAGFMTDTPGGGGRLYHAVRVDYVRRGSSSIEAAADPVGQLHFSIGVSIFNYGSFVYGSEWRSEWKDHGARTQIFYHGTHISAAKAILRGRPPFIKSGFSPSSDGMLGPGVYMSTDIEKARDYAHGVILKLHVRCKTTIVIDRQGHPWQESWQNEFDSAFVPAHCGMVSANKTETCVKDPGQILSAEVFEGGDLLPENVPRKVVWGDGSASSAGWLQGLAGRLPCC